MYQALLNVFNTTFNKIDRDKPVLNKVKTISLIIKIAKAYFSTKLKTIKNVHLMEKRSGFILMAICFFLSVTMHAQSLSVTGKVIDNEGLEVIGASVRVKGSKTVGTVTDIDGKFTIKVNNAAKDVLQFSFVGMNSLEVHVKGQSQLNVTMTINSVQLDEVVAIGYATAKRKDLTGSVSSIQGGELSKIPVTSVTQALAGKIAGVQITQSQGSPDADISVRVRGGMSITQSNEPLYIIDGFQSDNGLRGLDLSDIASIDVLKDASSTAIYGSAGANGVILITTKSGKEGKADVNYDMYFGFKKITKRVDVLSPLQFAQLEYERAMIGSDSDKSSFLNIYGDPYDASKGSYVEQMTKSYTEMPGVYGNRAGINWQDEVFDATTPISQNHKVSITGGTKTSDYNVSVSRSDDDGIMKGSGLTRTNIRAKFAQELSKKFRFTVNANYTDEETTGLGSLNESGAFSRMQHILQYIPINGKYGNDYDLVTSQSAPVYDAESGNQMQNPLVSIQAEERLKRSKNMQLNGDVVYKLTKNLTYRGSVGLRNRTMVNNTFYHKLSRQAINTGSPYCELNDYEYDSWQYNNTLTYVPKLKKGHSLDVLLGQEDYMLESTWKKNSYSGFPDNEFGFDDLSLGTVTGIPDNSREVYRKISFFGRANYNYKSKYLATVTLRADGSNRFGDNNKWGYFPAASLAWRASEEQFIEDLNVFSNLKLRFGYGMAGNDGIGSLRSLTLMSSGSNPFGDSVESSYSTNRLSNPNLKWETNVTANIGVEMGFFKQRLQVGIDLYNNNTKDLLLEAQVPAMSGFTSQMLNIGKTNNRGIELSINTVNIKTKNLTWETNLNLAHNKNKVVELAGVDYFTKRSGWATTAEFNDDEYMIAVNQSMGQMYGYKLSGIYTVDQFRFDPAGNKGKGAYVLNDEANTPYDKSNYPKPGSWKFEDVNDDKVIDSKDKTIIGNALPDVVGGFTNNLTYKGFDLSVGFNFQIGGDVYNANKMYFTKMNNKNRNSLPQSADRFTYIDETGANVFTNSEKLAQINQNATYASIEGSSTLKFHSGYVEDASYLRLNNVTFGYTFPIKTINKIRVKSLRVYSSAYNLWTLTNYSGFDPEVNTKSNGGLTPGVDWGAYPRSLSFVFGLNLTF